jgi:alanine racemase
MPERRPTWAEVDLGALAHNVRVLRSHLGPGTQLMAVVKADGYGHGALPAARAALAAGASWLGVAIVEEALALRAAGIAAPILVMGWTPPSQAAAAIAAGVDLAVFSLADAAAYGPGARLHVKVDTGMSRLGFAVEEAPAAAARIAALPGVEVRGVFTHFAGADEDDLSGARRQLDAFRRVLAALPFRPPVVHAANTAAILRLPEAHFDLCRAGIGLYGYGGAGLRPALRWLTRIAQIRRVPAGTGVSYNWTYVAPEAETLATLPVGYADGLPRQLSNRGTVRVAGRSAPIRGRVCMDQTIVSLEGLGPVAVGDAVALIGEGQWADQLAAQAGTIPYEILARIGPRVPRVHLGA